MSMAGGIRRIMRESKMISEKPVREFHAYPLEDNVLEWHFTMAGPADSPFAEGLYHGRILLPSTYPFAPPDVVLLTPNGRFELDKKICLSISSYHPENWHPTWGISTVLIALRDFMATPGNNGIGAIEYPKAERERLARESHHYVCPHCHQRPQDHWENLMAAAPPTAESDRGAAVPPTPEQKPQAAPGFTPPSSPPSNPAAAAATAPSDAAPAVAPAVVPGGPDEQQAPAAEVAPAPAEAAAAAPAPPPAAVPPPPAARPPARARPERRGVTLEISLSLVDRALSVCFAFIMLILVKKATVDYYDAVTRPIVARIAQLVG